MANTSRMFAALSVLLALLVHAAVASGDLPSAQVFLYPASPGRGKAVSVSPVQVNHILAHALNVPGEDIGVGASDREAWDWLEPQEEGGKASVQALFGDASQKSVILVTDVDEEDVQDIFPSTLRNTHRISSPPHVSSFEALLHSYGDHIYSALPAVSHQFGGFFTATVEGVETTLEATSEWLLGSGMSPFFGSLAKKVDDLRLRGETSSTFQRSVQDMIAFLHADKYVSKSSNQVDPYRVVRFDGMSQIKATYGQESAEFKQAKQLLRSLLEASVSKMDELTKEAHQRLAVVALPKQEHHLMPRSVDLLTPFRSSVSSTPFLTTRDVVDSLKKNNNSSNAPKESDFIGKCFTSESDLNKATANCSSHGSAIESSKGGRKCYRCKCEQSKGQGGKVVTWAGAACQKQDLSQPFVLLLSTTVGLMFIILGSILYLFYEGQKELPSVLAGISIPNK